ncbi:MAG: single-stranded DNA-binding protein [Oscillospiraceae bacterium]|nr:single-stranded DNA-binding protein [Oscillospiraceae bacterium]
MTDNTTQSSTIYLSMAVDQTKAVPLQHVYVLQNLFSLDLWNSLSQRTRTRLGELYIEWARENAENILVGKKNSKLQTTYTVIKEFPTDEAE